ncbi:MAG: amidohydrolase family protein, partial [Candidatus Thorarchaeota archaeon]
REAHYGDKKLIINTMAGANPQKLLAAKRYVKAIMEKFTIDDYIKIMDKFNVNKAIIVSLNVKSSYNFIMVTNDDIANFVSNYPTRFVGFGSIDLPSQNALSELEYAISSLGLKGIKLVPPAQKFDFSNKKYDSIWQKMVDLDVPLWTHGGFQQSFVGSEAKYGHPMLIDDLSSRFEDLTIIIGHMGVPWMWDAWAVVNKHNNVYVDISAHPYLYKWFPWDAFKSYNIMNKILFASDYPLVHYSEIFSEFEKVDINEGNRNKILWENAQKLLKAS